MLHQEDLSFTLGAQLVSAGSDESDVHGTLLHSSDLGGAVFELSQVDGDALFCKVALCVSGSNSPQGTPVGHVSNVQGNGFGLGFNGSGGLAASSQGQNHDQSQQHSNQLFHCVSS